MRADSIGMFWQELDAKAKGEKTVMPRALPPIPDTGWRPPSEFPNLASAKVIAIDCETKDVDLEEKGPGVRRGGHIVGLAVGTDDGGRWYFPMRHEVQSELNLDPAAVIRWARDNLCRDGQPKVGANLSYDLDYLYEAGVPVAGPFWDVQVAEPLLDENQFSYSLGSLAERHLGEAKKGDALRAWIERAYRTKGEKYRGEIWRSPPSLVGPYAEGDADLPLRILAIQTPRLEAEGLGALWQIESKILPMMVKMRRRGVKVDLAKASQLDNELSTAVDSAQRRLNASAGRVVDVNAANSLKSLFDRVGVQYPLTAKGNPSFTKDWLEHHPHPACMLITEVRTLTKLRDTFVRGYVLGQHINGRIHCQFNQLKGDDTGTVSGRFSSSNPNLQNIPSRDKVWGPKIRSLFIPEEGEVWTKHDWSQIEYRFLAHYGVGDNAEVVRERYRNDPSTDFHEMVMAMTGLDRKPAKNCNFGLVYGMGPPLLAAQLGLTLEDAIEQVFNPYHAEVPFVKATYERASARAMERGFIRTIGGRYARFNLYEERGRFNAGAEREALPFEQASAKWGGKIKRAFTHKALNRLLQGSAADLMKAAMVAVDESGVGGVCGCPLLTVHDELDHSHPDTKEGVEAMEEVKHIMETVMTLKVPIIAETESGPNWGEVE